MASINEEYPNYTYVEEEEIDVSQSEYEPVLELKEIKYAEIEMKSDDMQDVENTTMKRIKKGTTVGNSAKNSSPIIGNGSPRSNRGNRIILKKAKISPGSQLLDKSALFDGTFFSLISEHYKEGGQKGTLVRKFKGQCALCSVPVYITGTGSSTFNFLRHLKHKHGENVLQSYLSYRQQTNPRVRTKKIAFKKPIATATVNTLETVTIYVPEETVWKPFGNPRQKRPLKSVILEDGVSDRLLNDVRDFLSNSAWYRDGGIPYRRTYLLHGPSGCGKSSFVFALAGELNYGLCVLNLCERELADNRLNLLLNSTPENSIILLENVDNAITAESDTERRNCLTLDGFLNCLDGITAFQERVLFLTCVDKDRFDPSLLRPGRIDVKQYLGFCSQIQIAQLVEKFYEAPASYVLKFVQEVTKHDKDISPAQLQGFFLNHKNNDLLKLLLDVEQIWDS